MTIPAQLETLKSKLSKNESEEEEVDAITSLSSAATFVTNDWEQVKEALKIKSFDDMVSALEKIGLASEKDLKEKGIYPSQLSALTKENVKDALFDYIQLHIHSQTNSRTVLKNISKIVYRIFLSCTILFP